MVLEVVLEVKPLIMCLFNPTPSNTLELLALCLAPHLSKALVLLLSNLRLTMFWTLDIYISINISIP